MTVNTKNTNRSRLSRRQTAPLPVVVTPRDHAELKEEATKFNADLKAFAKLTIGRLGDPNFCALSKAEVALVQRIGGEIDSVRTRWRAMSRPATDDEISVEAGVLTQTVATAGNLNPGLMADGLSANIESLKPSLFALLQGCRAVQAKYRYLSIADVLKEIEAAQRSARHYSCALDEFSLGEFEEDWREEIDDDKRHADERRAERKRRSINALRPRSDLKKKRRQSLDGEDENGADAGDE